MEPFLGHPPQAEETGIPIEELTLREREVASLMAKGLTNSQIGDALGVGLETAKTHVSNVIAKTGAANRQEAAQVWQNHNRLPTRLRRRARGLVSVPFILKVTVGSGATALVTVIVVFSILHLRPGTEGGTPNTPQPYLFEGTVLTSDNSLVVGTPLEDSQPLQTRETAVRIWRDTETKWRVETESDGDGRTLSTLRVADGQRVWFYKDGEYGRLEGEGAMSSALGSVVPFGPIDLQVVLAGFDDQEFDYRNVGTETIFGRDLHIYEYGPLRRELDPRSQQDIEYGVGSFSYDPELQLVLRSTMDLRPPEETDSTVVIKVEAVATSLDLSPEFEPALFEFSPPADSVDAGTFEVSLPEAVTSDRK